MTRWVQRGAWWELDGWPGVTARVTTRPSGIAAGPAVAQTLRRVVESAGARPRAVVGLEQVHGAVVSIVTDPVDAVLAGCDGAVSDRPAVALTVRSADCLPILAYDPVHRAVGVAHAGWRGVKGRIPAQLVAALQQAFQSRPGDLQIAMGPAIGPCCYAVGPEFAQWCPEYLIHRAGGSYLDLGAVAGAQLTAAGIPPDRVLHAPCCTACTPVFCHSYRRDGTDAGRLVSWIQIS